MQLLDVRVVNGVREDTGYHPALLGHLHALFDAPLFNARSHARFLSENSGWLQ
jgi:hypothetical protein